MDTAENLMQLGIWSMKGFPKERRNIELFLRLTRKNLNALHDFPLSEAFAPEFTECCVSFAWMEKAYLTGRADPSAWATTSIRWAKILTQKAELL
jgi:hypothetical protein